MDMMSCQQEKEAVAAVLGQYAHALNSVEMEAIPKFYCEDGLFVPHGINRTFSPVELHALGNSFLEKTKFSIRYAYENITITGDIAFVEACAETSQVQNGSARLKSSRDHFAFKKIRGEWKIYRYIFNNVTKIK